MRETDRDPFRLQHMSIAAHKVMKYMEGKSISDLETNEILFFAVVKNIEIFGEAAYKLTKEFRDSHPELPWNKIIGMRHVLVHDYYQISPEEVYKVYSKDLPRVLPILDSYL